MKKDLATCIQTYSGILYDLANPVIDDIALPDLAHHLSIINRFTGASRVGYNVAQHCILVSKLIEKDNELKLIGLLHDASEAYLGDTATPLKKMLPDYRKLEALHQKAIIERFGLNIENFESVKFYDRLALDIESKALMSPRNETLWGRYKVEFGEYDLDWSMLYVEPMTSEQAEIAWLKTFNELWLNRTAIGK